VTVPYPAEFRRFGTDRVAMGELTQLAGGHSKVLEHPKDIVKWLEKIHTSKENTSLSPTLCAIALFLLILEISLRYMRTAIRN
jgi:hypothetical protein